MKANPAKRRKATRENQPKRSAASLTPEKGPLIEMMPVRLGLQRILVPFDFSGPAQKALAYAVQFADQFNARIRLLYVVEPIVYPPDAGFIPVEEPKLVKASRDRLSHVADDSIGPERLAGILVRTGNPYWEITQAAQELGTDLIIIATHGYSGLKHVIMGSTAERVVRHAPCPVLVVRLEEHDFITEGRSRSAPKP
jgi:universal stress protein A